MSKAKLVKTKDTQTREELADFLEALAERVRSGELIFEQAGEQTTVPVPESVEVTVEVKDSIKKGRQRRKLEVEVRWEDTPTESGDDAAEDETEG